jgi:hypothetical protein
MMFSSKFRSHYPDSRFIKNIKFDKLYEDGKPYIFHNAWNLSKQELELFSNRKGEFKPITAASLCACSALPFLDTTVEIDGDAYCEGTLPDAANFLEKPLADGRREELFVPRATLAGQFARLPMEYRRPFEDMGISNEETAPSIQIGRPPAPPRAGAHANTIKIDND